MRNRLVVYIPQMKARPGWVSNVLWPASLTRVQGLRWQVANTRKDLLGLRKAFHAWRAAWDIIS